MGAQVVENLAEKPPVGRKSVLLFFASWNEASMGPMDQVLRALAAATATHDEEPPMVFARVDAEECTTLSELYDVTVVPTVVLVDETGVVVQKIEGGEDMAAVTQGVQRLAAGGLSPPQESSPPPTVPSVKIESLDERLKRLVRASPVMLFMKGIPSAPKCGFSRQAVELLQADEIAFGSFDILTDDDVRQGLKKFADWPTYPQLYVAGELVGGLDIMKEMKADSSSLRESLNVTDLPPQPVASLDERLRELTHRKPVMLFMKGLPSAPKCGFSRQIVEILKETNVPYDSFDILQDEEVRQGLKKFSDWPTYPQLYVEGELLGGLDIVKELDEDGSLLETLNT